jgi:excisionase family DNA binding protein
MVFSFFRQFSLMEAQMTETTLSITIPRQFRDLLAETVEAAVTKALAELQGESPAPRIMQSPPLSSTNTGIALKPADRTRAADLRIALLTGKIPEGTGILIGVTTLAKLLHVSSRTVRRLVDEKAMPDPVRLGRMMRWRLAEILKWIESDCPPQRTWIYRRRRPFERKGK